MANTEKVTDNFEFGNKLIICTCLLWTLAEHVLHIAIVFSSSETVTPTLAITKLT